MLRSMIVRGGRALVLVVVGLVGVPAASVAVPGGDVLLASRRIDVAPELVAVGATGHRVQYLSRYGRGYPVVVSGVVLTPAGAAPAGGWPVVSWAHGTTGVSDRCAPSRDVALGGLGYAAYLARLVDAGYAVAATDYEGLGTPGVHPYLVSASEGRSVIDAVRAAGDLDARISDRWFAVGHSQGGHAAMAAGELAQDYGRGLDFLGTVALAPITDNRPYVDQLGQLQPSDHGYFMAIYAGLHSQYPELRFADYLGKRALRELPRVHTTCMEEFTNDFVELNLPGSEFAPRTPAAAERLRGWLGDNAVPQIRSSAPLLVTQGLADFLVPAEWTDRAVARAQELGTETTAIHYPEVGHYDITEASAADVLQWLNTNQRQEPTPATRSAE